MKIKTICIFTILLLITSIAFSRGSIKGEEDQQNDKFIDIKKKMEKHYGDKKFDEVINLYEKYCLKDDKAEVGKETMEFKEIQKGIRADIYQWVALSYLKKEKPVEVEKYLRKFSGSKALLNIVLENIEKKMQEDYYNRKFNELIELYNKYFLEAKAGKEAMESKAVEKGIRADIYRWVALTNFKLKKHEEVEIYLKKLQISEVQLNEVFRYIGKEMEALYENGKLTDAIDLYKWYCREDDKGKALKEKKVFKMTRNDIRADIYRLVALSYDDLDDTVMRDFYIKKILAIKYRLESDIYRSSWITMAEKKYTVRPRLMAGIKIGLNYTFPHEVGTNKDYMNNFPYSLGWQMVGGVCEYNLSKNLSVGLQLTITYLSFRYKSEVVTRTYEHRHTFNYFETPLLFKWRFVNRKTKLMPYLQIGVFYRILLYAHKSIGGPLDPKMPEDLDLTGLFRPGNTGFWVGAGIGYDTRIRYLRVFLEFDVNYKCGLNNIVNENQRGKYKDILIGYHDNFDDIKLRNWGFSFKIIWNLSWKAFKR